MKLDQLKNVIRECNVGDQIVVRTDKENMEHNGVVTPANVSPSASTTSTFSEMTPKGDAQMTRADNETKKDLKVSTIPECKV